MGHDIGIPAGCIFVFKMVTCICAVSTADTVETGKVSYYNLVTWQRMMVTMCMI